MVAKHDEVELIVHMQDDQVLSITSNLTTKAESALGTTSEPTLHSGDSPNEAVEIVTPDDDISSVTEQYFVGEHPCGDGPGTWRLVARVPVTQGKRQYQRLDVACSLGSQTRSYYFHATLKP